jgi:two-component system response regulator ChvI
VITAGDLLLDPLRLAVTWKGTPIALTVTEFLLLQSLVRRPGVVKTREHLMHDAYPDVVSVSDRTIDSHIKRIRRKFAAVDPEFAAIEGVYGAGYRFNQGTA